METIKLQDPKWYKLSDDCVSYLVDEYFFDKEGSLFIHSLMRREENNNSGGDKVDGWNADWDAEGKIKLYDTYEQLDAVEYKPKRDAYNHLVDILKNVNKYDLAHAYNQANPGNKIVIIDEENHYSYLAWRKILSDLRIVRDFFNGK